MGRFVVAVALVAALGMAVDAEASLMPGDGGAPAAARAAKKKKSAKKQHNFVAKRDRVKGCKSAVATKVGKRWRCHKAKRPSKRDLADGGLTTSRALLASSKVKVKRGRKMSRTAKRVLARARSKRLMGAVTNAARRVNGAATARAGGAPRGPRARAAEKATTTVTQNGVTATAVAEIDAVPGDAVGIAQDAVVEASKVVDGVKLSVEDERRNHTSVGACPDAQGTVTGKVDRLDALTMSGSKDGARIKARIESRIRGAVEAHVGDDGVITGYDMDVQVRTHVQVSVHDGGRVVATNAPELFTWDIVAKNVQLGSHPGGEIRGVRGPQNSTFRIGDSFYVNQAGQLSLKYGRIYLWAVQEDIDRFLERAQSNWQVGNCLEVTLTAEPGEVAAGEQAKLTATITPRNGASGLAKLRWTGGAAAGSLTPDSGADAGSPVALTFTAPPERGWGSAWIRVAVVSSQGKQSGSVTIKERQGHLELVYRHASALDDSVALPPYSLRDEGTQVEHRDIALESRVRIADDGTGSAPLNWTRSDWWRDTVESGTSPDAGFCTTRQKQTLTGPRPGTLTVRRLAVGPGGSVAGEVRIAGVAETLSVHRETLAGPCGAFDSTQDNRDFIRLLGAARGGLSWVDGRQVVTLPLDAGWQPGTGDVVAQLTLGGLPPLSYTERAGAGGSMTDSFQLVRVPD